MLKDVISGKNNAARLVIEREVFYENFRMQIMRCKGRSRYSLHLRKLRNNVLREKYGGN